MNERDLFMAIGEAQEQMLEESERKPRGKWKLYLVAAACLCLIMSIAGQYIHPPALPGQKISLDKLVWVQNRDFYEREGAENAILQPDYWYDTQFGYMMSVEAKVLDVLSDEYIYPGGPLDGPKYRILRLEVLEAIHGENMPSQIYYLLPSHLSTDLKQFDSLILTVRQIGCENTLMLNVTRQWMETFDFLFTFTIDNLLYTRFQPHYGGLMAFADGQLDMSLWELDGWNDPKAWGSGLVKPGSYVEYPGKEGRNIEQTKSEIRKRVKKTKEKGKYNARDAVITNADFDWPEAQAVLEYVKPFENGYFSVSYKATGERKVYYTRYINGFATNETICVNLDQKTVTWENTFSEKDIAKAPNLVMARMKAYVMSPPENGWDNVPYDYRTILCEYIKKEDHIFGLVSIAWGYSEAIEVEDHIGPSLWTVTWMLVYPDGTTSVCESEQEANALIEEYQSK